MFNDIIEDAFYDELDKLAGVRQGVTNLGHLLATNKAKKAFELSGRAHFGEALASGKTTRSIQELMREARHHATTGTTAKDELVQGFLNDMQTAYDKKNSYYGKNKKKILLGGTVAGVGLVALNAKGSKERQAPVYQSYSSPQQDTVEIPVNG
jgi:hypothetical protein